MANDTLGASLRFLSDAAHLLVTTAPETSAHLMTQRNVLMFENGLHPTDLQRQHTCGSCGHIMVADHGSDIKIEPRKPTRHAGKGKQNRRRQSDSAASGVHKRLICGMCGRYTSIAISPAPPISRRRLKRPSATLASSDATPAILRRPGEGPGPGPASPSLTPPVKPTANASSKKRAKSRKQGLQALLQQSQASRSTSQFGSGLSLSDFLKK
jgi:hypothetical protein